MVRLACGCSGDGGDSASFFLFFGPGSWDFLAFNAAVFWVGRAQRALVCGGKGYLSQWGIFTMNITRLSCTYFPSRITFFFWGYLGLDFPFLLDWVGSPEDGDRQSSL